MTRPLLLSFGLLLLACGGDGSSLDAGTDAAADVPAPDATPRDGGPVDAGPEDAGPEDTGPRPPLPAPAPTVCDDAGPKRLLWGDLHVHTSYSFDAFFFNSMNRPPQAYAFARGEPASYPCGDDPDTPCREQRLPLPLDFVALTDHDQFLGVSTGCNVDGDATRTNPLCETLGNFIRDNVATLVAGDLPIDEAALGVIERIGDPVETWERSVAAANEAYDPCTFTTLVGYEFSAQPNGAMLHRNILFRGTEMPAEVVSFLDVGDEWPLFEALDAVCPPGDEGVDCDYLAIPHNANLSDGRMFQSPLMVGDTPATQEQIARRSEVDVLLEVFQHKGSSECQLGYADPLGAEEDAACGFENMKPICTGAPSDLPTCVEECTSVATRSSSAVPANCTANLDMGRNAMLEGLRMSATLEGLNPFQFGFAGATDTHNGDPGAVSERGYLGHGGILDDSPAEQMGRWECPPDEETCATEERIFSPRAFTMNPGGLTGVWAEQNTREGIFDALARREAYATSGPRIAVRTYMGWSLPDDLCDQLASGAEGVEPEDVGAVAMGGNLTGPPASGAPTIVINAVSGPISGTPLQRIEVIKGWVDTDGRGHTEVIAVVGDATGPTPNAACAIDTTDEPTRLCGTYVDADFDPAERAFYYARVLENPTCRWSTWHCVEQGVDCRDLSPADGTFASGDAGYEGCCDIRVDAGVYNGTNRFDVIEERAWTSPVWY